MVKGLGRLGADQVYGAVPPPATMAVAGYGQLTVATGIVFGPEIPRGPMIVRL
jgi:hypothetical protein